MPNRISEKIGRPRLVYAAVGVLVVLAAVTSVLLGASAGTTPTRPAVNPSGPDAPATAAAHHTQTDARAVLAANTRQANQLLDSPIANEIARLAGVPVVINQWASWCANCRFEFPFFQQAGRAYAGHVAFVGLDSQDSRANASAFLTQFPLAYPSVFDPTAAEAQSLGGGQGWPTTIYMNAKHEITNVHVGAYPTLDSLQHDVAQYT